MTPSTPVGRFAIELLALVLLLTAFGAWVLRPAPDPPAPVFTCAPGSPYTVKEC